MFSSMGKYEACGIFTPGHFILMAITVVGILISLKQTENKTRKEVHRIIMRVTMIACILEVIKIAFNIYHNSWEAVNTYLPLYYCSMLLYAGIFSSFAKGTLKRVGDVFLATGSIIGGIVFIIYPSTSLPMYPAFHFLSLHSFLFHGAMVYLGILVNKTRYVELKEEDIKYFASLVLCISGVAFVVNQITGGNLMFISNDFPRNANRSHLSLNRRRSILHYHYDCPTNDITILSFLWCYQTHTCKTRQNCNARSTSQKRIRGKYQ